MDQNNGGCGWCSSALRNKLLRRLFAALVVVGFVFAIAAGVETARYATERRIAMKYAVAGYMIRPMGDSYRILPKLVTSSRPAEKREQMVRIFGSILKVEGNQVTVLNNAAQEQIVISLAETQIFDGKKEVGISALEKGKDAIFTGVKNAQLQIEARLIELQ
jgi:hypothetical protein